jgi:cellulose synthase/poly-beta-1,6-N-acetylglucosamine synthase-like glycosyltransferase
MDAAYRHVTLLRSEEHRGKAAAINRALRETGTEIAVLSDASAMLEPNALRALVKPFADEKVGATCGMLVPVGSEGVEGYRSFENVLRAWESRRHSSIGATGALYAFRSDLASELEEDTILDDVVLPLRIVAGGHRLIFTPAARVREKEPTTIGREFRRKARTLGGNYQAFFRLKKLFIPFKSKVLFGLLGHRVLRVLSPFSLTGLFTASIALALSGAGAFFTAAFTAQCAFYIAAAAGGISRLRGPAGWPWTFVVFQAAAAWGLVLFLSGRLGREWQSTAVRRNSAS